MVNRKVLTLDEFTLREMRAFPKATGQTARAFPFVYW
jgi:hypothetical protein